MNEEALPERVTVAVGRPLRGAPALPGAKYPAVRALVAAALGDGISRVVGVPRSDDTRVLLGALSRLGVSATWTGAEEIAVAGCGGAWPAGRSGAPVSIAAGNAGAVLRLLLGVTATLPEVHFTTAYATSLGQRPNGDLLDALRHLGVEVVAQGEDGRLPITLRRRNLHGGVVSIAGTRSSQYISALLMLAPLIGAPLTITVTEGLPSAGFVRLTIAMLAQAGILIEHDAGLRRLHVPSPQTYHARDWRLPRDFPSAAVWLAAGAIAGDTLTLAGLPGESEDGAAVLAALRAMGADITTQPAPEPDQAILTVRGGAMLRGAVIDGAPLIDSVPALAAAACVAEGTTIFTNVAALRLKESNRIDDLCAELCRAGAEVVPGAERITITGRPGGVAGGVTVNAHQDHRLAMALAILALRARAPLTITGAEHVAKSYPAFWGELARLGAAVQPG